MLAALGAVARGVDENIAGLHDAVCEYVEQLKSERLQAEQAVVLIKQAIAQAGLREDGAPEIVAVIDRVISLCIQEFYRMRQ